MSAPQTIELDCAPGFPRPDSYIDAIIDGTGLERRETAARFFGNWTWDYSDVPSDKWEAIQPTLKERISKLYHSGQIRYGSW